MLHRRCLQLFALALFVAGAAAQEFPFRNGPLDPSLHSNKIFFDIDSLADVAGVWKGVTHLVPYATQTRLADAYSGALPLDQFCEVAEDSGIWYSRLTESPVSAIVFGPSDEHEYGHIVDVYAHTVIGVNVTGFDDGLTRLAVRDDFCRLWRPYFDWEVGKTMYLLNRRFYAWQEEGQVTFVEADFCVREVLDHPYCIQGSFIMDGKERTGVMMDSVYFYECVAGPCLELPHTLPGYVKTQGWQPRN